jgi:hypothetical protein
MKNTLEKQLDTSFNKKCAEYLGWKCISDNIDYIDTVSWYDSENNKYECLRFDSDWNWIMVLLEAILEEVSEEGDFAPYHDILDYIPDLEKTKQAIIDYWNNE